jgi:acyl-CoA hydrolase
MTSHGMTPEERARDIIDEASLGEPFIKNGCDAALRKTIVAAIREAEEASDRFKIRAGTAATRQESAFSRMLVAAAVLVARMGRDFREQVDRLPRRQEVRAMLATAVRVAKQQVRPVRTEPR